MQQTDFTHWAELKAAFPSADYLSDEELVIFSIGGNKYRLIVDISFNQNRIFVNSHRPEGRGFRKNPGVPTEILASKPDYCRGLHQL